MLRECTHAHARTKRYQQVVVFDRFLSLVEVEALKTQGTREGFTPSVDAGKRLPDGKFEAIKSTARTSETSWCVGS